MEIAKGVGARIALGLVWALGRFLFPSGYTCPWKCIVTYYNGQINGKFLNDVGW